MKNFFIHLDSCNKLQQDVVNAETVNMPLTPNFSGEQQICFWDQN